MQLVPVLEIRHGKSVHTEPKNAYSDHVVSEDPMAMVQNWVDKGIKRIHFVDVDGIESGEPSNVDLLSRIKQQHPSLHIQVIGGIKCVDAAYIWMDAGADFLVMSGRSLRQKELLFDICIEFPGKVLVEVDSRGGQVNAGVGDASSKLIAIAEQLGEDGVVGLLVTEVPQQGHVNTSNLLKINELSQSVEMPIFANGGIEELADLKTLLENHADKLTGIMIGKVIHRENFCLNKAQQMLDEYQVA